MRMSPLILAESYIAWHYGRAYTDMFRVWLNFLWFVFNFFSIFTLLSTLFAPWKRMDEAYPKGLDIFGWLSTFIVNMLMRFVGLVTRTIIVLVGMIFATIVFLGGMAVFMVWTVMPIFLIVTALLGAYLLIYG